MPTEARADYETRHSVLLIDRVMNHFIKVGGIGIIAAVLGIFIFIFWQILPLFRGASVRDTGIGAVLPKGEYLALGTDQWGELPFLLRSDGTLVFVDLVEGGAVRNVRPEGVGDRRLSAFDYREDTQELVYGFQDGSVRIFAVRYDAAFEGDKRVIRARVEPGVEIPAPEGGGAVSSVGYGGKEATTVVTAIHLAETGRAVRVTVLERERTLFGMGEPAVVRTDELAPLVRGEPRTVRVNSHGDAVLVSNDRGEVHYFDRSHAETGLHQVFRPFEDKGAFGVAFMDFLFGGNSVVFVSETGENRIFSSYIPEGQGYRTFVPIRDLPALDGAAEIYSPSLRNKGFLIGSGRTLSLRYGTTGDVRWHDEFPSKPRHAALSGKYDKILFLDGANRLRVLGFSDPHPEAGWRAFFGKIWYESAREPGYDWQSSSGSDEFEPKLSLVPLIVGTLKGTFYALVFALPIALLAAIYTSQFLHPSVKSVVKPLMEVMASLPSVVLGFLAALWLAPMLEDRVPSVFLCVAAAPFLALLFGGAWTLLPIRCRAWARAGYEFLIIAPALFAALAALWTWGGPLLERTVFAATDPATGQRVADFRLWWTQTTGAGFEQRNSLVVGFMMGFAVIPIIFTITEDALSNVPASLTSASLALGASRWQTAMRIVVPAASAGILSAVMIGVGRAVGETMIVVMATGNTPIMDFNVFSGMRTLSANIAVELPEAPHNGTLYRTLFLGAMVLFLMTFFVNTLAEILRQHLREKHRLI
jgi:phosphate transport system permease protein